MQTLTAAVLFVISAGAFAQVVPPRSIDLDRPGELDALERDNPGHYLKIAQIRELASRMPCNDEFRRTLAVKFDAEVSACSFLTMTSYPSQRRLTFTLDTMSYRTTVQMDESGYRFIPLK
ncbi:hypothetical protein [Usitatibacter palustris]|uniref:UrcA family protein n=1 Tax=Usitatibacter palustris TaxID=2732487 RepID=A0A6M4H234_9PROT|nr:hypothetical protein [Usitatibacter palustris]QJR13526.1 hypothetical protein DSM104440_00310 [Usitatibacter palustris]